MYVDSILMIKTYNKQQIRDIFLISYNIYVF